MYLSTALINLVFILTLGSSGSNAFAVSFNTPRAACTNNLPIGIVQTYSAYACRGDLQTFNATAGHCYNAQNFTTARGYRKSSPPAGMECGFNYYASDGCTGPYVSTGKDTDGSENWPECIRNFLGRDGDSATEGKSFMFVCYGRL